LRLTLIAKLPETSIKRAWKQRGSWAQFASLSDFKKYLAATGETMSDQLFRSEIKLPSEEIDQRFLAKKGASELQRQRALMRFFQEFPRRWAAKTTCQPGYVVPNCREYTGALAPQINL
jgi:hypothetical protein